MNGLLKRFLSLAMAFVMVLSCVPATAFAAEVCDHAAQTVNTTAATCTEAGKITTACATCGEVISTEAIEATGHDFVDGACSVCGEKDPTAAVSEEATPEKTHAEGCTLAEDHEGDCVVEQKSEKVHAEGCTLDADHEGDCVVDEQEPEKTCEEDCWLPEGHEGDCEVPCDLSETCTLAKGHEGDCVPFGGETLEESYVAKVGSTEYATIDEAIANWTNGTTLTLLADVTLSDVIKLSSTEYHILDLGTYTMTAAKNKDAIQYVVNGRSSASYALDIKADATNPGGITATGGSIVRHTKPLTGAPSKDRPITRFYGGVFNASYVVRQGGTFGAGYTGASAPYFYFYGGEYNGTIYTNRSQNQFHGGTFNGSMQMSVDSSAYTLVAGGSFKNLSNSMGSELNSGKFTIGSAKGVYDKEVYVDDNGNFVIAAVEPSEGIEAAVAKNPGTNDYLAYSKVGTEGQLKYTDVYTALEKNTTATVTVYAKELNLSGINFEGTIVAPEGKTLTITNAPEGLKTEGNVVVVKPVVNVAEVNGDYYTDLQEAIKAAAPSGTVELLTDVVVDEWKMITEKTIGSDQLITLVIDGMTINGNGHKLTINGIESAGNGNHLFDDARNLTVKDLTIVNNSNKNGGIGLNKGEISNVTFNGGVGVFPLTGDVVIEDCIFVSSGDAIYFETERDGLVVRNNTFNVDGYAIILRGNADFTGNIITSGKVNVAASGCGEISGNNFGDNRFKVYNAATATISNNKINNLEFEKPTEAAKATFAADNILSESAKAALDAVTPKAAKIGETSYATLAEAFAAAEDGDTITLLTGIATSDAITNTKKVTLDLNGKTITGTDNSTGSFGLITNKGELTVTGNGTITLVATNDRDWNAYSSVISNTVGGKLTVESGTIQHLGGTDMAYGIDNLTNGKGTYAETVINGGTVKSTYRAIRQFLNGVEARNILTVNGGTIESTGGNKAIWMQDPSKNANSGTLTIGANAVINNDVYLDVTAGSTEWPVTVSIAAAALKDGATVVTENVPAGYELVEENGTYSVVLIPTLAGSGIAADPYLIKNVEDLILFRDSVNAGETKYNAPGVYVALADNIDLDGATWERGIGDGINATFDGIFDGNNKTIKNLKLAPEADSDGYFCGGLFGYTYGAAVIKNLVLENITVTAEGAGHNVGALVGFANNNGGKLNVSNVTVKNATINAPDAYGVGAIVGYSYRAMGTIENCSVDGANITGYSFVGGITGYSYSDAVITGCSVNNATITATSKGAGGIAGIALGGNKITGNTVADTTVTASTNWGYVVGEVSAEGVVVENNTAAEPQVGGSYSTGEPVQAKIGSKYYTTFAAAYAAAQEGDEITLLAPIVVNAGEELTLNKAVTITYTSNVPGEDMITNRGTLVVDGATLVYTNTDTTASNVTVSTISCEPGSVLEVKSGVVKNDSANNGANGIYAFAIDLLTNGNLGDVTATVSGGEVISTNYMAIRQFNNGTACKNSLTVTGGEIYGAKRAIQVHMDNDAAYTTISGGTIEAGEGGYALCLFPTTATNIFVTGGEFKGIIYSGTNGFISGGTFDAAVEEAYCVEGYIPADNGDGTYGVKQGAYVARNTTTGVGYESLTEAFAAAENDETITLLADIELDAAVNVAGKSITLDLNGKTISGTCNANQATLIYIDNGAKLTVKDSAGNGKITYAQGTSKVGWTVDVKGDLVLESGTIELTGSWDIGYAVDVRPNSWGTEYTNATTFVMNGGNIVSSDGGVRVASSSAAAHKKVAASFVMEGGKIDAAWDGVFIQQSDAVYDDLSFTITGGTIESDLNPVRVYGPEATDHVNDSDCMAINLQGGTMTYTGTAAQEWLIEGILRVGGGSSAETITANGTLAVSEAIANSKTAPAGYKWVKASNGNYELAAATYVAQVGETKYETLQDAINAADDATVTLLADLVIQGETYTIADGKSITLDMNGKTITATDDKAANVSYELFYNFGELIVTGNGTIELTSTSNDTAWAKSSSIFHNRGGVLNIENGTYKHLGGTAMAYVVDNNANSYGEATTYIKGGSLDSTYIGIRNRMDTYGGNGGGNGIATLNISGGSIKGKYAVWGHVSSSGVKGAINITGGTLTGAEGKDALVIDEDTTGEIKAAVSGGTFSSAVPEAYCAKGYIPTENADGTYGVKVGSYAAQIGNTKYESLLDAIKAAKDNDTIIVFEGKHTLGDLTHVHFYNNGDKTPKGLTIKGENGAVLDALYFNTNAFPENLTVENITFDGTGISGYGGGISSHNSVSGLTVNNCNFINGAYLSIANEMATDVTVQNCKFEDVAEKTTSVYIQKVDGLKVIGCTISDGYNAIQLSSEVKGTVQIEGNTISNTNDRAFRFGTVSGTVSIKDNIISNAADEAEEVLKATAITGGTIAFSGNTYDGTDWIPSTLTNGSNVVVKIAVAKINQTSYATLQAAIDAAQANDVVTLLDDITLTEGVTVPAGKTVTLDLNGKTIDAAYAAGSTTNHIYVIDNKGDLTITGNGTINTRGIYNYGTMTLENGTINAIDGNGGYGVRNYAGATFTMNGGTIATTLEDDHKVNEGGYDATTVRVDEGATFKMNGGAINNICDFTFAIDNNGTATINNGTVTSIHSTVSSYGTLTINGGTFTCNGIEGITAHALVVWDGSTTTITGGTFDGKDNYNGFNVDANEGATVEITGGNFLSVHSGSLYGKGTITVSGGTFFDKVPEARCANGYIPTENANGTYGVKVGSYAVRNTTTGVGYETLAAAIAAAKTGETVTLLADVTASEVIMIDKSVTINGNDHKVTSSATRVFRVTAANVEVALNDVNMVSTAVRVGTNDVRGISIDTVNNVKLTLNNCSVDFTDASANDWAYAVNVTGGSNNTVTVNGGTYEGANVINVRGANQTVVVKDATLTSTYPNDDVYYGAAIYVVQNQGSSVEATGNTFNGTNAVAFNLGTGTTLTASNNTDNTTKVVAKIGETHYTSLADAFAAAENSTIILLHNIAMTEGVTVPAGKTVILDLNGKTITGTDNATGSFGLFTNKGELTVTGNGAITLTATNNRGWNAYSSVISNTVGGKLIVESGTIEHLGGTDMAYGIDNLTNGKGTYAETVINGGTVKSTYRAIRQFLNGVEAQNILTVNGGTIEGANKSIWMQDPSTGANSGKLTVGEGAVLKGNVYLTVTAGSTVWPVEVTIAAAALADGSEVLTNDNIPEGYVVEESNGVWGVREANYVAQVGNTKFESFEEALAAACADASVTEIVILCDSEVKTVTNTTSYYDIVQNLKITAPEGEKYTVTVNPTGDSIAIRVQNGGSLTIAENVTIDHLDVVANGFATTGENMTINGNLKALSLKQWTTNGTITVSETGSVWLGYGDGQFDMAYGNGTVTVNGNGDKTTAQFKAGYSGTRGNGNTLNLNNTYFEGGAWFNIEGSNGTINVDNSILKVSGGDAAGSLTITSSGNTINLTNGSELAVGTLSIGADNTVMIAGGSVVNATTISGAGKIVIDGTGLTTESEPVKGNASGFTGTIEVINNADLYAEIQNGKIVLVARNYVAQIGEIKYESLAEAVAAAETGATITMIADETLTDTVKITADKDITLDLNGNTIDGTGNVRIALMSYGDLTIKDSSAEKDGVIKAGTGTAGNAVNICAGTFTLESGSIYSLNNAILVDEQAAEININGGTITAEPATNNSAVMYISSTSNTVVNITAGEMTGYNGILLWNNTAITMTGGTIEAKGSTGIQGNGSKDNTEINISGDASISGYYAAIYHPQGGELNISGDATLTGWTGVVVKGGTVKISGGTISGTGAADTYRPVSSGYVDTGDGLYVECYDNSTNSENYGTPTVTVTGGIFTSANGKAVASYANTNNNVEAPSKFISGGTFNTAVEETWCAEGYIPAENADGTYGVKVGSYVARVNGVGYETITAAINAANDGDTVNLLAGTFNEVVAPWAKDSQHTSEKSITIVGAENFGTVLNGGMYLGYDDSGCREHTITIKGIAFEGKGILVAGQKNVVIDGNKFTNITDYVAGSSSASQNAISVIGKNVNATVTNNVIDTTASGGIHLRDVKDATVIGNSVANVQNNSITINPTTGSNGTINVVDNTLSNWGLGGEGRAMRISGGATVTVNGNVMTNANAPEEFVKVTGAQSVDASKNYWGGKDPMTKGIFATDLKKDPAKILVNYYTDAAKTTLVDVTKSVAESAGKYYTSLADALADTEAGATINLLSTYTVAAGEEVTIDLAGKTIVGTPTEEKAYEVIKNYGTLTITDSVGGGKIQTNHTQAGSTGYAVNTITNCGTLTINGAVIENKSTATNQIGYAIDNNSTVANAILTINSGEVTASGSNYYDGIRLFCNSVTNENTVTVNGGTVSSIWMQNPSDGAEKNTKDVKGNVTITGGVVKALALEPSSEFDASISGGHVNDVSYFQTAEGRNLTGFITGGTFGNGNAGQFLAEGYTLYYIDANTYGVKADAVASVAGEDYATLQDAINAANGETVYLKKSIVLKDTVTVPAGTTVTLNLKGYTISQVKECTASYEMINNKGTLTITDSVGNGKISFKDTSAGDPNFGWGSYTIRNEGTLVVENGTIEHLGEQNKADVVHMYCAIWQYSGSTTINGGTISTPTYRSIRLWQGDMTINGGTMEGQVWVQAMNNSTELTINGGNFAPTGVDGSSVFITNATYDVDLAVTGGTFNTKIGASDATKLTGSVTGGLFTEEAKNGTNVALLGNDHVFTTEVDENGFYTIKSREVGGKIAYRAYIADSEDREAIQIDLENVYSKNSLVVELYDAKDNLLTVTTAKNGAVNAEVYTVNIVLWGKASSSWDTEIIAELTTETIPETIKLYADGTLVDTFTNALGAGTNVDETAKYLALDILKPYVAEVNGTQYKSLQAAIDAANGQTVTVLTDIVLAEGVTVAAGTTVTLDLNDKTISRDTDIADSTAAITNHGILTIEDSVGGGMITAFAANPDTAAVPYYASNTISNYGVLNVAGGTIENSTGDEARAAFPIDNNSSMRDAIVNITGGTVTGRGAIRQFTGSTFKNEVNISGGTVTGTSYGIWMQNPGSGDPAAALTISGGTVSKVLLSPSANFVPAISDGNVGEVAIWNADTTNVDRNPHNFITGGTFTTEPAAEFIAKGFKAEKNDDGTYGIVKLPDVAEVDGTKYKSLEEAIAVGGEVKVLENIELTAPITVAAGKTVTLDLNGKTVSYTSAVAGDAMITNNGNLIITDTADGGKIVYTYNGTPDSSYGKGNYTIQNYGTLTVASGTVENATEAMSHASYAINTNAGATLNVEGGKVLNLNAHAIRQVSFGTAANEVNISGGYIEGTRAIQVQLPGSAGAAAPEMTLNISGGELKSNEATYNLAVYVYSNGQSAENVELSISGDAVLNGNVAINEAATNSMEAGAASVTGGTLNGEYGIFSYADTDTHNTIAITGGTFATEYSELYATDDGYEFVENNGKYEVVEAVKRFAFYGTNVSLGNNLDMMFAFRKDAVENWSGHYVKIVRTYSADKNGNIASDDVVTIPYAEWTTSGSYYVVNYGGVAAKEMCDTVTVTVYNANGEAVSEPYADSMREYAMRKYDAAPTVFTDMLNYGAAAQTHFGYGTDDLANSQLTTEQLANASELKPISNKQVKDNKFYATNLTITSNIQYLFAFNGITSDMYATATFTGWKGNKETVNIPAGGFTKNGSVHVITLENLVVADARCMITVTVYNKDGSVYSQVQDSIESYIARNINKSDVFSALMKFSDTALEYLSK